jgi:hypothetical protein
LTIRPTGSGWKNIKAQLESEGALTEPSDPSVSITRGLLSFLIGSFSVYFTLFGIGYLIYGNYFAAIGLLVPAVVGIGFLLKQLVEE